MIVIQTNHFVNKTVTDCFAKGTNAKKINIENYKTQNSETIASYGILRGTGELLKKSNNFYYIDHGYIAASKRNFEEGSTYIKNLNGYFRIVKNDFIGLINGEFDNKRLSNLNLNFKDKRKSGEYIILSEPSKYIKEFFNLKNWTEDIITELNKITDRKIFVHNKQSNIPLDKLLINAWSFISFQSTAGFKAMVEGVPAHFTYKSLRDINPIENIESAEINYKIFNNLSYSQWTLNEIIDGAMNDYL